MTRKRKPVKSLGQRDSTLHTDGSRKEHTGIKFTCPFCGQSVTADGAAKVHDLLEFENPRFTPPQIPVPMVLHGMPACQKFLELEPDEYLRAVRLKIAENKGTTT